MLYSLKISFKTGLSSILSNWICARVKYDLLSLSMSPKISALLGLMKYFRIWHIVWYSLKLTVCSIPGIIIGNSGSLFCLIKLYKSLKIETLSWSVSAIISKPSFCVSQIISSKLCVPSEEWFEWICKSQSKNFSLFCFFLSTNLKIFILILSRYLSQKSSLFI